MSAAVGERGARHGEKDTDAAIAASAAIATDAGGRAAGTAGTARTAYNGKGVRVGRCSCHGGAEAAGATTAAAAAIASAR